jgi:hypothetical protein
MTLTVPAPSGRRSGLIILLPGDGESPGRLSAARGCPVAVAVRR